MGPLRLWQCLLFESENLLCLFGLLHHPRPYILAVFLHYSLFWITSQVFDWHHLRPGILGHLGPGMFDWFCISFCFESQGLPSVPPGTRTRGYWLTSRIRIGHLWVARLRFKMHFPPFKCQISFYNFNPFSRFVFTSGDLGPLTEPESEGHWRDNCQSGSWVLTQFCLHCLAQFCSQSVTNRCVLFVTVFNVL